MRNVVRMSDLHDTVMKVANDQVFPALIKLYRDSVMSCVLRIEVLRRVRQKRSYWGVLVCGSTSACMGPKGSASR